MTLNAFLQAIPDSDEQAANALKEEIRSDERLGSTPDERTERFAQMTQYLRNAMYCLPVLVLWSTWYPRPYWLLIAVLALIPWACLLAMKMRPGVLQLGDGRQGSSPRPDVAALLFAPILLLALRAFQDIPTLDWQAELKWTAAVAVIFGVVLFRVAITQPPKWSVAVLMGFLCLGYGYGSTVTADALLDRSQGQVYRTHVLAKHVSSGRYTTYSLTVDPWSNSGGRERVSVRRDMYSQLNVGNEVCIGVHPGALGVPWYSVMRCLSN